MKKFLIVMVVLAITPWVGDAAVTNISMTQILATQRVRLNWDKISTVHRYRIKIMHGETRIARKLVDKPRAKFPETKFQDGEQYTAYVKTRLTGWTTYTFTYQDIDHDNDLISDLDDPDDDNDGLLDADDPDDVDGVRGTVYFVTIQDNQFNHGTITILQGDSVTWVNQDEGGHAVSANNNSWFSPPLQANESYTHIFNDTGVFSYYDPTHPTLTSLTGTITVTQPL